MPAQWIVFITILLNNIFYTKYPDKWNLARLTIIFKKGLTTLCDNYRGISVMNNLAKIYDYVITARLSKWYRPDREQAGAQRQNSCTEHILALRLLFDFCLHRKRKLFVVFVDYSKAYDRLPRRRLMAVLKRLGCGMFMLAALASMYTTSKSVLGLAVITAVIGVRQGAPSSCFLFTLYVNTFIRLLKERCAPDGFLQWLHCLLFMDDTIIFATSRQQCDHKVRVLMDFCTESGMELNQKKTQFMVINGDDRDRNAIYINDTHGNQLCAIHHTDKYVYLGSFFTADGRSSTALKFHVQDKQKHLLKLAAFCRKNSDMPFFVKLKVLNAAFLSAILYGCESWINVSLHPIEKLYHAAIKTVLGVRMTTSNELALLELGFPRLIDAVKDKQKSFISTALEERRYMTDDPLMFSLKLHFDHNTRTEKYIKDLLNKNGSYIQSSLDDLMQWARLSEKSKVRTYMELNPDLLCLPMYSSSDAWIPEYVRSGCTRFRLSAHRLKIETGRWSRIPREQRLCACGSIQTERHVVELCPLVQHIRDDYPNGDFRFPNIFDNKNNELLALKRMCDQLEA